MNIYRERTPLKSEDIFVVLDSFNNGFDYPIHNHPEFEINLILGMSGTRIVGDSTARYMDKDLVLLGPYLYHKWDGDQDLQQREQPYRVITIQFGRDLFGGSFFQKKQFLGVQTMLRAASRGICYTGDTFAKVARLMIALTEDDGYENMIIFLRLMNLLANAKEATFLASEGFSPQALRSNSSRMQVAYAYILQRFADPKLKMGQVARAVNMNDSAFSHFFKKYAFRSFTQFLLGVRIGHACKLLMDTDLTVSQISGEAGFNNLANFNRLFKKYRASTPKQYRRKFTEQTQFDWNPQTNWRFDSADQTATPPIEPNRVHTRLIHL